ncbi:MAG: M10 family metallopeptidase C-terminal domain-containing protein [Alphaproteobacteria bacterium]|nr:M10 family metallopeptidase C-terminal domain-containing protein [Alphaproteobacteria bacterium]
MQSTNSTSGGFTAQAVTVSASPSFVPASGNQDIDGIISSLAWSTNSLTFSFPTSALFYEYTLEASNNFEPLNAQQQAVVRSFYDMIESICGLTFTEITETATTHADLRFAMSDEPSTAYASYPWYDAQAGDSWYNNSSGTYDDPDMGTYAFSTFMHEMGHTLGLKHGHETDTYGALPTDHDSLEYSVMTYRSYVGSPGSYYTAYNGHAPQTLMLSDIAALQYMYGANYSTNSGNTTYTFSPTTGEMFINGAGQGAAVANVIFRTIWDGGGTDTYSFSNYTTNLTIDLNPGEWSTVSSAQLAILGYDVSLGGLQYARGNIANAWLYEGDTASLIENAIGGSGNDAITGNQANNSLTGNNGNDTLIGGAGNDVLNGGNGTDTASYADASSGVSVGLHLSTAQAVGGGLGTDTLSFIENLIGSDFNDNLIGSSSANLLQGGDGADMLAGIEGSDTLEGGGGNDLLFGGTGVDSLSGGDGDDTLYVEGNDSLLSGGAGYDVVTVLDAAGVSVTIGTGIEFAGGYTGNDTLNASALTTAITIGGAEGNDTLTGGTAGDLLAGGTGVDTIHGGEGNDTIFGDAGADALYGDGGDDNLYVQGNDTTLEGGTGYDRVYVLDAAGVSIGIGTGIELVAGYTGDDTFNASALTTALTLGGALGNDTIYGGSQADIISGGGGADYLVGNGGADVIFGDDDNDLLAGIDGTDTLYGGGGGDLLFGGTGVDNLSGGDGNDTLYVEGNDALLEGGAGHDVITVLDAAGVSITIGTGIEFAGGYTGDDTLNASAVTTAITIGGAEGNDTLTGGTAGDLLAGGTGVDTIHGGEGNDIIFGDAGADALYGDGGDDSLYVVGNDSTLEGGTGYDRVYVLDAAGVSIGIGTSVELVAGYTGDDTFDASALTTAVTLGGALGNDTIYGGTLADVLSGGSGTDILVGNGGADVIFGDDDADSIYGGAGDDAIFGGSGGDTVYLADGSDNDTIYGFEDGFDIFDFSGHSSVNSLSDLTIMTVGSDVQVLFAGGQLLIIGAAGQIDGTDFGF